MDKFCLGARGRVAARQKEQGTTASAHTASSTFLEVLSPERVDE